MIETKEAINERLAKTYGHEDNGMPRFRMVWSEDEIETRVTERTVRDANGNFLRMESGALLLKKYSYLKERWVLERLIFTNNRELASPFSYEPFWVFDKNGEYQDPNWRAIEFLCNAAAFGIRKTISEFEAEDAEKTRKEIEEYEQFLHDQNRSLTFAFEDSVFLDSTKRKVE